MSNVVGIPLVAGSLLFSIPVSSMAEPTPMTPQEKEKLLEMIRIQKKELEQQKQEMLRQEQQFRQYQQKVTKELADQQKKIEGLISLVNPEATQQSTVAERQKPVEKEEARVTATPAKRQVTDGAKSVQPVGKPPETTETQRPLDVAAILEQPGVLTPKGSLSLEPSLMYSYSSSDQISLVGYTIIPAITIGLIDVHRVSRDTFVGSLTARYGLTNRLELEGRIPYVYRYEEASTSPFATNTNIRDSSTDGHGIGDIDMAIRYQLNQQRVGGPSFIASLRVKSDSGKGPFDVNYDKETNLYTESPTGSGFWGVQPGLTAIFPTDPAVFFGSVSYTWNIEKDVGTVDGLHFGKFDPGDFIGFSFGMGLAFNEKASFSLGYDHTIVGKNKINGHTVDGEVDVQVGILTVGYSYLIRDNMSTIVSLGVGVTDAAPDAQITVKVPINIF